MSTNPYEAPSVQYEKRRSFPWIMLSVFLFAMLIMVEASMFRSHAQANHAREQAIRAMMQAEQAETQARKAAEQAEVQLTSRMAE